MDLPQTKLLAMVDDDKIVHQLVLFTAHGAFVRDDAEWIQVPLDLEDGDEEPIRDDLTPVETNDRFISEFDMMMSTHATLTAHDALTAAAVRHVRTPEGRERFGESIGEVIHPDIHPVAYLRPDPSGLRPGSPEEARQVGIPPGYTNVLVNTSPGAVTVGRGTDSKGRHKYFYSSAFHQQQAAKKFSKIQRLHDHIASLDEALSRDADTDDTAGAVLIARRMGLRPSSKTDTKADVQAYGASTLLARHTKIENGVVELTFIGKGGKNLQLRSTDPDVIRAIQARLDRNPSPDDYIFDTSAARMVKYVREYTGPEFTTKDLRTYLATALALQFISEYPPPQGKQDFARFRREIGTRVSEILGNTPQQALAAYINPAVFYKWMKEDSWHAA